MRVNRIVFREKRRIRNGKRINLQKNFDVTKVGYGR